MPQALQESLFRGEQASDEDEVAYWAEVHRRLRQRCAPLAHLLGHKNIAWPLHISGAQLSKELSGLEEKHLGALTLLLIARTTRDEELNRYIICDLLGFKMPERQDGPSPQEEVRRLQAEVTRLRGILRGAAQEAEQRNGK